MGAASRILTNLVDRLRHVVPRQRRSLVIAVVAASAICIVALASTLLVLSGLRGAPSSPPPLALATGTATDTATDTVAPTRTLATTHTPTTLRRPTPVSVVHAPPPPPVPTHAPPPPTATPCPTATAVPPTATGTATAAATTTSTSACQSSCPTYTGNNPSQSQIRAALYTAADTYHLPRNLLLAVAWQESRWHEDVTSCDGGIGLMQLQYYTWHDVNSENVPACGLTPTNYDPMTLQGNANLGAKYLVYLSCFYSYWGNNGGTSVSNPGAYTIAWYYQQAGLQYPDTKNADGSVNSKSFCAAFFNDPAHPEYAALPSTTADPWSCTYSATATDWTLLDITLSAYNQGITGVYNNGIQNSSYVYGVEGFIPQFAAGTLPK